MIGHEANVRQPSLTELPPPPPGKSGWPWTEASAPWPQRTPGGRPWPRVGVVTPSLNQARFIEETIRSVLLQGHPEIEYIIIDGGSTDGTLEILRKYEPWLTYWTSEPDRGQSHAANKGFILSTSPILGWLNSDDVYRPNAVRRALEMLEQNPGAGLLYGRISDRDENGVAINRFKGRPFTLDEMIWGRNPVAQSSAFVLQSALEHVGWLDEDLHYAMDFDLWLRLGTEVEAVFVDEIWSDFRYYPSSKSGEGVLPFLIEIDRALERAFAFGKLPPHLARQRRAALARSKLAVGMEYYECERDKEARLQALRALRRDPRLSMTCWRDLLRCMIGSRGVARMKSLYRWAAATTGRQSAGGNG